MLITPLYNGQGLGNQLANYVTVRTVALDRGYKFGVAFPERFKGTFINLDMGETVTGLEVPIEGKSPTSLPYPICSYYEEIGHILAGEGRGVDIRGYDSNIPKIGDNTCVHGLLQGERYFEHRKDEIRDWLRVEPKDMPSDVCVLNFRGGEYVNVSDFFLEESYWRKAMEHMKRINPCMRFIVVTDDVLMAKVMLPDLFVSHDMAEDWRTIRYAKYVILSNSTFGWFPTWLGNPALVIYPKYYGRHNVSDGYWCLEQNVTKGWLAMDKNGKLFDYDTCQRELKTYYETHTC